LKELWSENRSVTDANGIEIATAFVLQDSGGREIDAHALRFDDSGNGIPAWDDTEGFVFKKQDLAGEGRIAGISIPCISFEMQVKCHTGYELPESQARDLELMRKKFDVK
jgi:lincosamide nucleotidyltransferase A/C/D/E